MAGSAPDNCPPSSRRLAETFRMAIYGLPRPSLTRNLIGSVKKAFRLKRVYVASEIRRRWLFHLLRKPSFRPPSTYRETTKGENFFKAKKKTTECLVAKNAKIAKSLRI